MQNSYVLEMKNISKYIFNSKGKPIRGSNVKILSQVDFNLKKGEVHVLIGENGAGKSTLMKILGGILPCDEGEVFIENEQVQFKTPKEAREKGVAFIHQEINLCPNIDVARNMFLGKEPKTKLGLMDKKKMNKESKRLIKNLGYDVNPNTLLANLSTAQQQIVEIAKALSYESKIIIMDEPTASLSKKEIDMLFDLIKNLKAKGVSVIYISHRLEEIQKIGDRITVLRDGMMVGNLDISEYSDDKVIKMMAGRTLETMYTNTHRLKDEVVLDVRDFKIGKNTQPLNLNVRAGEIVGLCGLVGSGRSELAKSIFGARNYYGGTIEYYDEVIKKPTPHRSINMGMVYLSEDRKTEGLIISKTIRENIVSASLKKFFQNNIINKKKEKNVAKQMVGQFNVVCRDIEQNVRTLSGGNQQKVSFAKAYAPQPKLLILDEPTRGIDVSAKSEIYKIMDETAKTGVGILMISSDMPELIGMSDRVYIMREGTVTHEICSKDEMNQEKLVRLMIGSSNKGVS